MRGRERASQFSTNQSLVAEFGRALCLLVGTGTKKEMPEKRLRRRLWSVKVHLFQAVNKGLIGLRDSYQDRLALF